MALTTGYSCSACLFKILCRSGGKSPFLHVLPCINVAIDKYAIQSVAFGTVIQLQIGSGDRCMGNVFSNVPIVSILGKLLFCF